MSGIGFDVLVVNGNAATVTATHCVGDGEIPGQVSIDDNGSARYGESA
ncbi:hypothetical protein [Rhodococcus jostii]